MIQIEKGYKSVGIDVSKNSLDVFFLEGSQSSNYANNSEGIAALVKDLGNHKPDLVVFESTGGFELQLLVALVKKKLLLLKINE